MGSIGMGDAASGQSVEGKVIRRMFCDRPASMLPLHRAFRMALSEVADETLNIEIAVQGIEDQKIDQQGAIAAQLERGVHFSTHGPNSAPGMVIISQVTTSALIEIQTVGNVSDLPVPDREPTPIDAAIIQGFVSSVLSRLGEIMHEVEGEEWILYHKINTPVFDLHRIPFELPDIPYRMLRASVSFGVECKTGDIAIIFPKSPVLPRSIDLGNQTNNAVKGWQRRLNGAVNSSHAVLSAILLRNGLSVSELRDLKVGSSIPLPRNAPEQICLEGIDGNIVAYGKIGMANGMKAVRIVSFDRKPAPGPEMGAQGEVEPLDPRVIGILDTEASPIDEGALTPSDIAIPDLPEISDLPELSPPDLASILGEDEGFDDLPELNIAN